MRWLLLFDYTNRKIVSQILNVSDGALSAFYRALIKRNYITLEQDPISVANNKIILLTKDGFDAALTIHNDIDIQHLVHKKTVPPTMVRHQLILQSYLVSISVDPYKVVTDKILRKRVTNTYFIPDAIAIVDGKRVAIEMELTRKKPARIYYKFGQQINAMRSTNNGKKNLFTKVYFVFVNETLMKSYMNHFEKERWPHVVMENSKLYIKESVESDFCFLPNKNEKDLIEFKLFGI